VVIIKKITMNPAPVIAINVIDNAITSADVLEVNISLLKSLAKG